MSWRTRVGTRLIPLAEVSQGRLEALLNFQQMVIDLLAACYAVYHGPAGLTTIAARAHRMALILALGLERLGYELSTDCFFDTVTVRVPGQARRIAARARESRINLRVRDPDHLGIAFDETTRRADLWALWRVFATRAEALLDIEALDRKIVDRIPRDLCPRSPFLSHPVLQSYHSETEMLRYLKRLAGRDIALDRAMIPLGSCTMKLNATTEHEQRRVKPGLPRPHVRG